NALAPIVVAGSLQIPAAILAEASLRFLGLADPNRVSWGGMLNQAQNFLQQAWWMPVFPGVAILLTVLSFNLAGAALKEALAPLRRGEPPRARGRASAPCRRGGPKRPRRARIDHSSPRPGLEQLDRITVRILHLNLLAARTDFHLVAKPHPLLLELGDDGGQVLHSEDHPVPSTRFLLAAIGHRSRARRPWATEDELEIGDRDLSESGQVLQVQLEPKCQRIEENRALNVSDLISHAPQSQYDVRFAWHRDDSPFYRWTTRIIRRQPRPAQRRAPLPSAAVTAPTS